MSEDQMFVSGAAQFMVIYPGAKSPVKQLRGSCRQSNEGVLSKFQPQSHLPRLRRVQSMFMRKDRRCCLLNWGVLACCGCEEISAYGTIRGPTASLISTFVGSYQRKTSNWNLLRV